MLHVFHGVADHVAATLAGVTDWGFSGARTGQYAADVAVDAGAVERLVDAGVDVLSEESGPTGTGADVVVVLDPLDGSTNASRGIPWFATSLCAVDEHGPLAALVANQATGERFEAVRGHGAWRGDRRLRVSPCAGLAEAIVGVSGPPSGHGGWWQFRALGAAALDLGLVAAGSLDAYVDLSVDAHGAWDYLGGALLVSEAGGVVVDALGRDLVAIDHADRRTPVAAGTPAVLDALLERRPSLAARR